jgi:Na+-transporting methylmalonyl-CoA/oxaloacetate decarboxylase gamma subunit
MSILEVLGISLLGMCVVFLVLVILMFLIKLFTAVMSASEKRTVKAVPAAAAAGVPARGSVGEIKTFDVPDQTAAMIMAIVADEIGAPLNELRFLSIKQVEDGSK